MLFLFTACASTAHYEGFSQAPDSTTQFQHYQSKDQHIFISILSHDLSHDEAERLFQSRKDYIRSLYLSDADPYFGRSVRAPDCIQKLNLTGLITENESLMSAEYGLPSTEKFVFGICNPKLESFLAKVTYIYCKKSKNFFEAKYFKPKELSANIKVLPQEICESRR